MDELFGIEPIRPRARRGVRTVPMRRPADHDLWPRRDRDPSDVAILANRVLVLGERVFEGRLRVVARRHGVDPYIVRLLLLFAESNRPLRIGNVAELLGVSHPTASRAATRAHAAGLVDKFDYHDSTDERSRSRLTVAGRAAVVRCLDALRAEAAELLGLPRTATVHSRGAELAELLGPLPYLERTSDNAGWRAGVRAGMPDE